MGILNTGQGSYDVAIALAERLSTLKVQEACASSESDKDMIFGLIQDQGGFDMMNVFLQENMRDALKVIANRFENDVGSLFNTLAHEPSSQSTCGLARSS